jgi:hypothetical protein
MNGKSDYFKKLLIGTKTSKKQVAVYFDERKLERIDMLIKVFSSISDSKSFSRNMIIEEALEKYLTESEEYLLNEHGINLESLIEEEKSSNYDTVILSSSGTGFEEVFLGEDPNEVEKCWYPCKISDSRKTNLKYIAIYRGQPVSAITHYAKIKSIEFNMEKNCKVCYFDGEPIELPNQIGLGNKDSCFFVGAKYTKLEHLLNANSASDLTVY